MKHFYLLFIPCLLLASCAQRQIEKELNFVTPSLAALQVKGHVMQIIEDHDVANFSPDGELLSVQEDYYIKIGPDNYLLSSGIIGDRGRWYEIDPATMRLIKVIYRDAPYEYEEEYYYDQNGKLTSIKQTDVDYAEDVYVSKMSDVRILQQDSHNNWLRIQYGNKIRSRRITYYPNPVSAQPVNEGNSDFRPYSGTYSFIGTIGGCNDATLSFTNGYGTVSLNTGQRQIKVSEYNQTTGILNLYTTTVNGDYIGYYQGTYANGTYSGTFYNKNGGTVHFHLTRL